MGAGDRVNDQVDWENVAEEIEALGKSQAREPASRIAMLLVHLIKLAAVPAIEPRAAWQETIVQQRGDIERLLADSPSLRTTIQKGIDNELGNAGRVAALAPAGYGERPRLDLAGLRYTADQVLGAWYPDAI